MQPVDDEPAGLFQRFVARAAEGRNSAPRVLIGTLIVIAIWLVGTFALMAAGGLLVALDLLPDGWTVRTGDHLFDFIDSRVGLATAILTLGAIWPGVWMATRVVHRRSLSGLLGVAGRLSRCHFGRAMIATGLVGMAISLLTLATEARTIRSDLPLGTWGVILPVVAVVVLVQTSAEELLFRGYLLQNLAHRFRSPLIWAVMPAAVFGAAHWSPATAPWMNAMVVFSTFTFAMAAVVLVWATGNLGAAMGMHFANNMVAFLFLSAESPAHSLSLYVVPAISDPTWTITDAIISAVSQVLMTGLVLALLLWRRSPLRIGEPTRGWPLGKAQARVSAEG